MTLNIKKLSFLIFFVPLITIIFSYFFSIHFNYVETCFPNIDGCTSISRIGRYAPVSYFFKPLMFMSGILIFFYWRENFFLIKPKLNSKIIYYFYYFGLLSVVFLFLYVVFLGESNYYKFFRKIGIFIFIFFTIIAELLLSISYLKLINNNPYFNYKIVKFKFFFNIVLIILGIILFPIVITKVFNYPNLKNIISWNYFSLILINFLITFFCWNFNKVKS